jgi:hypothetical protein
LRPKHHGKQARYRQSYRNHYQFVHGTRSISCGGQNDCPGSMTALPYQLVSST